MIAANKIIKIFVKILLSVTSLIIIDSNFASDLRFEQLTIKSGLPSLAVNQIIQDSDGYIWFATRKGIVKYNGYYFENFNSQSNPSLLNDTSYKIIEDLNHNYWITSEGGLTKINDYGASYYFDGYISNIILTDNNFFATFKNDIYVYNRVLDQFELFNDIPFSKEISSIYPVGKNSFIVNKAKESFYYNDKTKKHQKLLDFNNLKVEDYVEFENYYIIATKDTGIFKIDKTTNIVSKIKNLNLLPYNISGIQYLDSHKNYNFIVVYENGDITKLNLNNNYYIHQKNKKNIEVSDVLFDDSGVFWMTTKNDGVFKYSFLKDGANLTVLNESPTNIFTIANEAYYTNKEKTFCITNLCKHLPYLNLKHVWEVKTLDNINYFISHKGGFSRYNIKTKKLSLISNNITAYTFSFGNQNEIYYFSSSKKGINKYLLDTNEFINILDENSIFKEIGTYALRSHYSSDVIYIGTINGLYSYNLITKEEILYPETQSLNINDLLATENGIWLAVQSKGLYFLDFNTNKLNPLNLKGNDFSNITLYNNSLYLTHNDGVIRYDLSTKKQNDYKSLFVDLDFEFANSNWTQDSLYAYFGTNNGYLTISKNDIEINKYKAFTRIDKIIINDEEKNILTVDDLDYENNNLRVYFSSSDNSFPENIKYKYRLFGFNNNWKITSNNFVDYTNLSSGKYIFEVLASNSDGIFTGEPTFYSFNIKKPWWYFVLFILCGFTVVLICFIALNRFWQIKQLKLKAITDSTTGIYNRYKFNIEVEKSISKNIPFSLIFFWISIILKKLMIH